MKLKELAIFATCGSLLLSVANAQDAQKKEGAVDRRAQMEQRQKEMMEKLGLTDEQKEKFKVVLQEERQKMMEKMQELRAKGDVTPEQRKEAMLKLAEDTIAKIKEQKILTDEQITKWK